MQEEAVIVNTQYWVFSRFFKNPVVIYGNPKDVGCSEGEVAYRFASPFPTSTACYLAEMFYSYNA